jgi:hypothetical protein
MVTRSRSTVNAATLLASVSGCGEILNIPEDVKLALEDPWHCLDAPEQPVTPRSETATVRFMACDFISNCSVPVTGLSARLCDKLDVGCNNPRLTDIRDTNGVIEVDVPTGDHGFDGYLEVSTRLAPCFDTEAFGDAERGLLCTLVPECDPAVPTAACDIPVYAQVLWFFNPPVVADIAQPIPLELYPSASLPLIVDAAGGSLAPGTGSVFMTAIDCNGQPAPGVTLDIAEYEDEATPLYFDSGVISNTVSETDSSGVGGFIRIPPGFVEITGLNRDAEPVAEVGVHANPAFVTYTVLSPAAAP